MISIIGLCTMHVRVCVCMCDPRVVCVQCFFRVLVTTIILSVGSIIIMTTGIITIQSYYCITAPLCVCVCLCALILYPQRLYYFCLLLRITLGYYLSGVYNAKLEVSKTGSTCSVCVSV
jgi:hypothetical protein